MIQSFSLFPGVMLRCFRDSRFKQGALSIQFIRPMDRQEAPLNALIPAVLLRGCKGAPDLRAITLRLDDLYGASVGPLVRRVGDYQTTGLYSSFIADRYGLDGDKILASMTDFLRQLLLEPVTQDGVFAKDFVESEKKNLIAAIEAQRNDKRAYASAQLLRKMCAEDSFGIPRLGEAEQVAGITPEAAYAHYRKILVESPVELFYVGEAEPEQVAALMMPVFADVRRNYVNLKAQTAFQSAGGGEFTETLDVAQGRLAMGFVTPITLRDPDFAAMQVCNTILGAGMTSKLFMNIREKMSLCYDIGSGYHGSKGIMVVSAGIDFSKEMVVRQEVLRQLQAVCNGDITPAELTSAKQALCSSLRSTHDSPGAIESYYATAALSGLSMTPGQYLEKVEDITARQVSQAAKSLKLDTVFFLKGVR